MLCKRKVLTHNSQQYSEDPTMANEQDAEIEAIKLKIDNLLVAAGYRGLPHAATVTYFREVQVLRHRLLELGGAEN